MDDEEVSLPSFSFWQSFRPAFDNLSNYEKGFLITWMIWYAFDNVLPTGIIENRDDEWKLLRVFRSIIPDLDRQKQKYVEYLEKKKNEKA